MGRARRWHVCQCLSHLALLLLLARNLTIQGGFAVCQVAKHRNKEAAATTQVGQRFKHGQRTGAGVRWLSIQGGNTNASDLFLPPPPPHVLTRTR